MYLLINGFEIFGVSIKFYGILMALAFIIGLVFAIKFAKQKGYASSLPYDLILIVFPSAIVGARLNYVLFTLDRGWTFLEVLQIWNGGLMIYGGVLFAVGAIAIYCAVKKISFVKILDMLAPCLILGQAIGRWGNFFNQEAYGALITNPSFQWFPFGVYIEKSHFTSEATKQVLDAFGTTAVEGAWFNATFFYESMWCLIGFVLLYFIYTKTNKAGLTTASYFVFYGIERFFVEMLRTDSLYLGPIKISVLISLLLVVSGIVWLAILFAKDYKNKKQVAVAISDCAGEQTTSNNIKNNVVAQQNGNADSQAEDNNLKNDSANLQNKDNDLSDDNKNT
ncbi:MAG: prolipoprotein diacylglyceryl transferase [Christensenellales bacterium]